MQEEERKACKEWVEVSFLFFELQLQLLLVSVKEQRWDGQVPESVASR